MAIELNLSVAEARAVHKALNGPSTVSEVLTAVYYRLEEQLREHDEAQKAKGPWRKVVDRDKSKLHGVEVLECGHRRMLNYSKNWVEDWAERRRCRECAGRPSRFA